MTRPQCLTTQLLRNCAICLASMCWSSLGPSSLPGSKWVESMCRRPRQKNRQDFRCLDIRSHTNNVPVVCIKQYLSSSRLTLLLRPWQRPRTNVCSDGWSTGSTELWTADRDKEPPSQASLILLVLKFSRFVHTMMTCFSADGDFFFSHITQQSCSEINVVM